MLSIEPIAHIKTDFKSKFGVPRQSGIAPFLQGKIIFTSNYRNCDALRGLEDFSHIWLIWHFSANNNQKWQPLVRPPRLGGNTTIGVFASRSPFRPNGLGLSVVKIESIETNTTEGPIINVLGADLMNNTPIFDIKPYINYADSIPNAQSGFVDMIEFKKLNVVFPASLQLYFTPQQIDTLLRVLENDPRPPYQNNPQKEYGFLFADYDIHFLVEENNLYIIDIKQIV